MVYYFYFYFQYFPLVDYCTISFFSVSPSSTNKRTSISIFNTYCPFVDNVNVFGSFQARFPSLRRRCSTWPRARIMFNISIIFFILHTLVPDTPGIEYMVVCIIPGISYEVLCIIFLFLFAYFSTMFVFPFYQYFPLVDHRRRVQNFTL